jgi:hypothetical protein
MNWKAKDFSLGCTDKKRDDSPRGKTLMSANWVSSGLGVARHLALNNQVPFALSFVEGLLLSGRLPFENLRVTGTELAVLIRKERQIGT